MNILEGVRLNILDVRRFGPSVLARHLARFKKNGRAVVRVPDVGTLVVRAGDSDMETLRQIFVAREYDFSGNDPISERAHARYRSILAAGGTPIIVDAGANIGAASLCFAAQFPQARIVAIEPDPANADLLRDNLRGKPNCAVLEAAVSAERGFVSLINKEYSWATRTERSESGVTSLTIQDAFDESGGDTPFLVKVDIEGFEKDLFSANTDWIGNTHVVIIEPHDWLFPGEFSSRTFQTAMARQPFEIYVRGENLFYLQA